MGDTKKSKKVKKKVIIPKVPRDKNGRFLKGSNGRKKFEGLGLLTNLRELTKQEIYECARSLVLPMGDLEAEMDDPSISRLRHVTGKAIMSGHHSFIQWLVEMAIGKARQITEIEDKRKPLTIKRTDGSEIVLSFGEEEE